MNENKLNIEVVALDEHIYGRNFEQFLSDMKDILQEIPDEYRESAIIETYVKKEWYRYEPESSTYSYLKISYFRPETDEEQQKRLEEKVERQNKLAEIEKRKLKELLDKYPDVNKET